MNDRSPLGYGRAAPSSPVGQVLISKSSFLPSAPLIADVSAQETPAPHNCLTTHIFC
jgi:hypothetical protein